MLTKHYQGGVMGRACGTYGGEQRCLGSYDWETLKKGTTWETQARWEYEGNIKMDLQEVRWGMG